MSYGHDETAAVEELKGLSANARLHISHHIRNTLMTAQYVAKRCGDEDLATMVGEEVKRLERAGL